MFDQFIEYTKERVPSITKEELDFCCGLFKEMQVKKGEIIVEKGEICKHIYFINQGCLKTYFLNEKGVESINGIAIQKNFSTIIASFIAQIPSNEYIEALEDSELLALSYDNYVKLLNTYPIYKVLYQRIIDDYNIFMSWRMECMMSMEAKDRYETLKIVYPALIKRLSKKVLAAYIGISQETLCRLK